MARESEFFLGFTTSGLSCDFEIQVEALATKMAPLKKPSKWDRTTAGAGLFIIEEPESFFDISVNGSLHLGTCNLDIPSEGLRSAVCVQNLLCSSQNGETSSTSPGMDIIEIKNGSAVRHTFFGPEESINAIAWKGEVLPSDRDAVLVTHASIEGESLTIITFLGRDTNGNVLVDQFCFSLDPEHKPTFDLPKQTAAADRSSELVGAYINGIRRRVQGSESRLWFDTY